MIGTPTGYKSVFTADPDSDKLQLGLTSPFEEGSYVQLYTTGTLPTGLKTDTRYFVRTAGTDFRLSETPGGPYINIQDSGAGQHTVVEQGVTSPGHQAGRIVIDRCIFTRGTTGTVRRAIS